MTCLQNKINDSDNLRSTLVSYYHVQEHYVRGQYSQKNARSFQIGYHENIITFLGVVADGTEFCVVLERAEGDLLTELKRRRTSDDVSQRFAVSVSKQVVSAMVRIGLAGQRRCWC
jgi:hypothetical protein